MSARGSRSAFVLHGFKAALRDKPSEYLTNSQRTSTSSFLSQSTSFSAGNMRPKSVPAGSSAVNGRGGSPTLDELELSLHDLKLQVSDLRSSLDVDFASDKAAGETRKTRQWPLLPDPEPGMGAFEDDSDDAWFLGPRRRSRFSLDGSATTIAAAGLGLHREAFPVQIGAPHIVGVPSLLPPAIPVRGRSPVRTAATVVLEEVARARRSRSLERWAADRRGARRSGMTRSRSQSPKPAWRPSSAKPDLSSRPPPPVLRSRRSGARGKSDEEGRLSEDERGRQPWRGLRSSLRSLSAEHSPGPASRGPTALDVSERFVGSLGGHLGGTSPYGEALRRLRRQRLRVEEELLLELKRQLELERTRGPRPKWYEMRGPQFHYEARKNNNHLRSSAEWQRIYDYRNQLLSASHTFREGLANRP
uniref:Uncharacterized protein LOC116950387 n=1 Tax=Petromyzon marinus TaxID=7757 RepID=A0AAJ7TTV3_PETMA|nr:uncharacterized protein LOC116950387 [Petromyzon marinus]